MIAFARTARTYWLSIYPRLRSEMRWWRRQAEGIPDPVLREAALYAQQSKLGNIEGAVAFATLAAPSARFAAMQAMACFEAIFDYLDCLCEMPTTDPIANGRQLNQALITAVKPSANHVDYYAFHSCRADNGYLCQLVDACRIAFDLLPSRKIVNNAVQRASERLAAYQTFNHGDASGSHLPFELWARKEADLYRPPNNNKVRWWEIGASAGSSLIVFALMATAANPRARLLDVVAIEDAYFPWIGAVNSLLDSLVDQLEDAGPGQHRLLDYYASPDEAAHRLAFLVSEASRHAGRLETRQIHLFILAAMVGFYLGAPTSHTPELRYTSEHIRSAANQLNRPAMLIMESRLAIGRIKATGKANSCAAT